MSIQMSVLKQNDTLIKNATVWIRYQQSRPVYIDAFVHTGMHVIFAAPEIGNIIFSHLPQYN